MSSQKRRCGKVLCGFTVIELLVVVLIIAVVATLVTTAVIPMRKDYIRTRCLQNARSELGGLLMYSADYRDSFPAYARPAGDGYALHPMLLNFYWWEPYSGITRTSDVHRCPAHTRTRDDFFEQRGSDYYLSSALYYRADMMRLPRRPSLGPDLGGRVNSWPDIVFPSQKSVVYEAFVWHDWNVQTLRAGTRINGLLTSGTSGKVSVAFADGHVRGHRVSESTGYAYPAMVSQGPFCATLEGVWGVDIR